MTLWDRDAATHRSEPRGELGPAAQGGGGRRGEPRRRGAAGGAPTRQRRPRIDALVNCAGITGPNTKVWDYPVDDWLKVMQVNLNGLFYCCREVVPHDAQADYGRIVNIASVAGKDGNPNASAYSASKAAVIALTKSLGKELADTGVRVNCVTPAAVKTAIFDQMTRAAHPVHAVQDPDGPFRHARRGGRDGRLAVHRGMLVLDRRRVRPVGRALDVLDLRKFTTTRKEDPMKLVRYGNPGKEKPGLIDAEGSCAT